MSRLALLRYTGLGLSIPVETFRTNKMLVYFSSDETISFDGFRAYFSDVSVFLIRTF